MLDSERVVRQLDIDYAYRLAKRMEEHGSNPTLGYRPAGSDAEKKTGEMLRKEMLDIGLTHVRREEFTVDGWEFHHAEMLFDTPEGKRKAVLGAYQTTLQTDGWETCQLVYVGRGEAKDYAGLDVKGKLVLADINQRDEWWINYPVYQAHLKGAKALIAVQRGGYGDADDEALNAQDIAGPADAPAFSMARRDADALMGVLDAGSETTVSFCADTRVIHDTRDGNIIGEIEGEHPDRLVLLSAHYDSYFSGFQDDNTAIAMMLGLARAIVKSGCKPKNTLVFCAMAAEEWGVTDSWFDWSTGAFEQVNTLHPEWAGKVIADLNFELPAVAHGTRARIRCCYEYVRYLQEFMAKLPQLTDAYRDPPSVVAPIETMSDDFSMAIAGIPSMVNDFTGGSFMETHYHSQLDAEEQYDPAVYRYHHELFAYLLAALDHTCLVPLCFAPVMERVLKYLPEDEMLRQQLAPLRQSAENARQNAEQEYRLIRETNLRYEDMLNEGREDEAEQLYQSCRGQEKQLLTRFKQEQDTMVRIDWDGHVFYPHELVLSSIEHLQQAEEGLRQKNLPCALRHLYQVDNNAYAFTFDEDVFRHFTTYMTDQPKERLKWGAGRLMPHADLYTTVRALLDKHAAGLTDCQGEQERLHQAGENQKLQLEKVLQTMMDFVSLF